MTVDLVTVDCGGPGLIIPEGSVYPPGLTRVIINNKDNGESPCACYQQALDQEFYGHRMNDSDITIYVHDDVTIHDPEWLRRVMVLFEAERNEDGSNSIVAVGLGGAPTLGNKDLYRKPYNIWNMARRGYVSNQTDAEVHGRRFTGVRRVAVIEQFFMAIRTSWIRSIGGWPTKHLTHHCMDMWLACEAARHQKQIYIQGCSVTHHGGGSSTKPIYPRAEWLQGGSMQSDHILPHLWIYNEYRDVLPIEV